MKSPKWAVPLFAVVSFPFASVAQTIPSGTAIDAEVGKIMSHTHANGMAIAVIDHGKVGYVQSYGVRNAKREPLATDTVMYGASLTKTVFAHTVMQLVDQGKLNLDTPIKTDLDNPLPSYGPDPVFPDKYGPYKDLAGDSRWEKITPRMCLTHSTGFSNFWFIEPDQKLHIHFEPGTRFSYSGDGWNDQGQPQPHDKRSKVRAAGSMNTTITDLSKFTAALVRGDGLSSTARAEITRPLLHIGTASLFPLFLPDLPLAEQRKDLYSGLGVIFFHGPQGNGFYKGGHDGQTANTMVCIEASQRCILILSNDVRSEAGFTQLARFVLSDTGVPYDWVYRDHAGKS